MSPKKSTNRRIRADEVARHKTIQDLYVVIYDKVYDVTSFVDEHPGGTEILIDQGGQDATEGFDEVHHSVDAHKILAGLQIGVLQRKDGDDKILGSTTGHNSEAYPNGTTGKSLWGSKFVLLLILLLAVGFAWTYFGFHETFNSW